MASRVPSHGSPWKAKRHRAKGKDSYSQCAEIMQHQSIEKLRTRWRSQEANEKLKSIDGLARLLPFASDFKLWLSEISSNQDIF